MATGRIKRVLLAECGYCHGTHQFDEGISKVKAEKELKRINWEISPKYGLLCKRCKFIANLPPNPHCNVCEGPCYCAEIMAG